MKAVQKNNRYTTKKLYHYIGRHIFFVALSVLLAAAYVVLTLYIPVLTGDVIDLCFENGLTDLGAVTAVLVKLGICVAVAASSQWLLSVCNNRTAYKVGLDIRNDAFRKMNRLPVSYFDSHAHGDILSRITNDIEQVSDGLLMGFTNLFTGVLTILMTLVFMLRLNPLITAVVVVVTPLSLFVSAFIAKHSYSMFQKQSGTRGEQTAFINENIENQKAINAYGMSEAVQEKFDEINGRMAKYSLRAIFYSSLVNPCTRFVNSLVYAGVGVFGAISAVNGGISIGGLSAFLAYAGKYTKPFNEISGVITEFQNAFACATRVFEFLDEKELEDKESVELKEDENTEYVVDIDHVSFSYVPEKPLITDFNLKVKEGQKIAIVGPTGCGKTTLINLLMRFYDVKAGSIKLRGNDIREMSREQLRKNVAMVLQDTWLRHGTVRENIALNSPDATDAEIEEAARKAHALSFIKRLPAGFDTVLSENGDELSQGQKQLICIARVMLKTPPILILDEATSSIDTRTEIRIQKAFNAMMEGRTSFVVAHRLSTIQSADVILVMKSGNVVEMGNHVELMAKKGFYSELYYSQF
ncbi:MAG: ABC transporter ATP-binding protein/permease [Lachnospiraceae bacterium]|nr:ABC transporter ATP-binding protein/permease [Lachnospiraceae bacterium]